MFQQGPALGNCSAEIIFSLSLVFIGELSSGTSESFILLSFALFTMPGKIVVIIIIIIIKEQ